MTKIVKFISPLERAVEKQQRICFGIAWFASEDEAWDAHQYVQDKGHTYNGGIYHGRLCGRNPAYDRPAKGANGRLYAVTY